MGPDRGSRHPPLASTGVPRDGPMGVGNPSAAVSGREDRGLDPRGRPAPGGDAPGVRSPRRPSRRWARQAGVAMTSSAAPSPVGVIPARAIRRRDDRVHPPAPSTRSTPDRAPRGVGNTCPRGRTGGRRRPGGRPRWCGRRRTPARAQKTLFSAENRFSTGVRRKEVPEKALTARGRGCWIPPTDAMGCPVGALSDNRFSTRASKDESIRGFARGGGEDEGPERWGLRPSSGREEVPTRPRGEDEGPERWGLRRGRRRAPPRPRG